MALRRSTRITFVKRYSVGVICECEAQSTYTPWCEAQNTYTPGVKRRRFKYTGGTLRPPSVSSLSLHLHRYYVEKFYKLFISQSIIIYDLIKNSTFSSNIYFPEYLGKI